MTVKSYWRGHEIEQTDEGWRYTDTNESVVETWKERSCGYCRMHNTVEGHDGCLGELPGIINACCGHGREEDAYLQFPDNSFVIGKEVNEIFSQRFGRK